MNQRRDLSASGGFIRLGRIAPKDYFEIASITVYLFLTPIATKERALDPGNDSLMIAPVWKPLASPLFLFCPRDSAYITLFKIKFRNTEGWYKRLQKKRSKIGPFF